MAMIALGLAGAAPPALAADDLAALRAQMAALARQLQAMQAQSQQQSQQFADQLQALERQHQAQVDALTRQVEALKQFSPVQPAPATAPAGVPPQPGARNVVVTQQPGNLPARVQPPPAMAMDVASPGTVAPAAGAPVASGADKVRLTISGQVDRALLYGNDGRNSNVRNVDNNASSTRLRLVGEGRITDTAAAGINVETELRPNSSATTTLTQSLPQPASAVTFTARQAEAYAQDSRYGGVRLGFGSTASYLTNEADLSGTLVAGYVNIADYDGGFAFRQKGARLVPASRTGFALSPDGAYGPAVGAVFNFMDGLVRDDRLRYDSPAVAGFQASASILDGGAFDLALRYAGQFDGNRLVAGAAFADADGRPHVPLTAQAGLPGTAATLYGYAGVPSGANGTIALSTPAAPATGDVSANGSKQYNASASLLLQNGLNLTVAGGYRAVGYRDPLNRKLTPVLIYTKLGYRVALFDFGTSAVSADYAINNELQFRGDKARAYGVQFVQTIDPAAVELFVSARYQTLSRTFASYHGIAAAMTGARVRF